MVPVQLSVGVERQAISRVGNVGAGPWRAQKHSLGHIALPEGHRFAKEPYVQAFQPSKVRCRGKAIRASADNHHITFVHGITDLLHNSSLVEFSETRRCRRGLKFQSPAPQTFMQATLNSPNTTNLDP